MGHRVCRNDQTWWTSKRQQTRKAMVGLPPFLGHNHLQIFMLLRVISCSDRRTTPVRGQQDLVRFSIRPPTVRLTSQWFVPFTFGMWKKDTMVLIIAKQNRWLEACEVWMCYFSILAYRKYLPTEHSSKTTSHCILEVPQQQQLTQLRIDKQQHATNHNLNHKPPPRALRRHCYNLFARPLSSKCRASDFATDFGRWSGVLS